MERKVEFATGEYYHLFSRGNDRRKIFVNTPDWLRFQTLLYVANKGLRQGSTLLVTNMAKLVRLANV